VTFRVEVTEYDDPAVITLIDALLADLDDRYGLDGIDDPDADAAEWRAEVTPEKVRPPHGVFLVALDEASGEAVGCGGLKRLDDATGEVKRMYTTSAGRRRGIGRALLARLEDEARALGYTSLQLETGGPQHEAVGLYESAGWTRIPPYGRYSSDPRSICFRKDL
jgi:GNAT superfamily N-acetyltransferase